MRFSVVYLGGSKESLSEPCGAAASVAPSNISVSSLSLKVFLSPEKLRVIFSLSTKSVKEMPSHRPKRFEI